MLSTLALYGFGAVVVLGVLCGIVRIIKKGARAEVAAKVNMEVVENVEQVNRARADPDRRKRVRSKYRK